MWFHYCYHHLLGNLIPLHLFTLLNHQDYRSTPLAPNKELTTVFPTLEHITMHSPTYSGRLCLRSPSRCLRASFSQAGTMCLPCQCQTHPGPKPVPTPPLVAVSQNTPISVTSYNNPTWLCCQGLHSSPSNSSCKQAELTYIQCSITIYTLIYMEEQYKLLSSPWNYLQKGPSPVTGECTVHSPYKYP